MADSFKNVVMNRKARHEYEIIDTYEAGIELKGTEVKSIRQGRMNINDSYCYIESGEIFLENAHVSPYEQGNIFNVDPLRKRRLLMHKREILRLFSQVKEKGFSLIPLRIYLKNSNIKVEVALCRGKKLYDKREASAKRDAQRQMDRALKGSY